MTDRVKNILIGSFVAIAFVLAASLILFLKPTVGDGKKELKVRFSNLAGIGLGTRVTFAGKPIGEVSAIHDLADARSQAVEEGGKIYPYELTLKLDSTVTVYSQDEIAMRTTGLMGEKSIAILPKSGNGTPVTTEALYANAIDPFENTVNQIGRLASKADTAIDRFNGWFDSYNQALGSSITSIGALSDELKKSAVAFNSGEGTVGRFFKTDDFYLRLSSLLSKGETLLNDVNHYGLLFQYDKHWKRSRTKRANALESLSTPADFRAFFEREVDTINTSLGRLTTLLEEADGGQERDRIQNSPTFRRDFAALMRQAEALCNAVKLYNESLVSTLDQD